MPKFSDYLSDEKKKLLAQKVKRRRRRRNPVAVTQVPKKDNLPAPIRISARERELMEIERIMRGGGSWQRVNGAIRQTRHNYND
ncbi:hypothetical protein DFP93_103177 [Aneurinibacillus soli]|uniref:Uncharacterized protein n=1 Tax=Aneurinibacillus soli TaxID=1500254 RepID=A0A0U5B6D4_9BACL|nr:hypothetical protein [Aneurinibacillus soli]PYE62966.1 hypothetical protein DFP93_103177 [Aneurinibacillus soli]BAU28975.1 hypothetical protein CB4_03153 [Aneurinibacillus soli]